MRTTVGSLKSIFCFRQVGRLRFSTFFSATTAQKGTAFATESIASGFSLFAPDSLTLFLALATGTLLSLRRIFGDGHGVVQVTGAGDSFNARHELPGTGPISESDNRGSEAKKKPASARAFREIQILAGSFVGVP